MWSIFIDTATHLAADKFPFGEQKNGLVATDNMPRHRYFTLNLCDCVGNFVHNSDK